MCILLIFKLYGAVNSGGTWIEKAGINGIGSGANTVRFYAGGTLAQAINLVYGATSNKASFAVTESGRLFGEDAVISGTINATGGVIGGFKISQGMMESSNPYNGGRFVLFPDDGFIAFSNPSLGIWSGIGANVMPGVSGIRAVARFENTQSNPGYTNYSLYVSSSGGEKNVAIAIGAGMVSGLNLHTERITTNTNLTNQSVFVSLYNATTITLNLPSNPETGKMIFFRKINRGDVFINGNSKQISMSDGVMNASYNWTGSHTYGAFALLIFDGQYWCWSYMNK